MKKNIIGICILAAIIAASCATTDVQAQKIKEIRRENKKSGTSASVKYISAEDAEKREQERRDADTKIIIMKDEVFVPIESQAQKAMSKEQVVQLSMQEALVTPNNFIGGTQFYDYNEYKQYPVVCKVLSLTVIQLENGEIPIGVPYLSDTLRWELTGDLWRTVDGMEVQLVIIKPLEPGLSTNMILVTNQRIYQFVLSSTRDSYMPMVKFRYPLSHKQFITARTLDQEAERSGLAEEGNYLSYNYKIKSGWAMLGWFKPGWQPTEVWDDGHKTYVRLPRGVLQREYPVIFEKSNYIINYRVNENIIIIDKLISSMSMRLNHRRVRIYKSRGEAKDLRRYVKHETEVIGSRPEL